MAAGEDSQTGALPRTSMGFAQDREEDCTNPLDPMLPSIRRPQSLPQDLLESAGPAGCCGLFLWQQHCTRLRQQDELAALSDRAASGTGEANDKTRARHAATMARAKQKVSFLPSIPW